MGIPFTIDSDLGTADSTLYTADMTELSDVIDPSDEILTLMKIRLVLSYDGKSYPVYTVVPKNRKFDYVLMALPDLVTDDDKDTNAYECTQLFDIVTFGGERGSWKAANSLSTQIMTNIIKREIKTTNFQSTVKPIIDSTNHFIEIVQSGLVMRKLIRFRYNIQQL